jgi:hypothetical protein
MGYSGSVYGGAWARRTQQDRDAPLKPGLDPEHADPTDQQFLGGMSPTWVANQPVGFLPGELIGEQGRGAMPTGLGPLDMTPSTHAVGMGIGPGLDTLASMDRSGEAHQQDQGAVAAQRWAHQPMADGANHLDVIQDVQGNGASPDTLLLEEMGVGVQSDYGNSRRGRWYKRWNDRPIDMHRWDPQMRPQVPRYAVEVQPQGPVVGGNQYNSEYATYAGGNPRLGVSDRFVEPIVRRQPSLKPDAMLTSDGSNAAMTGTAAQYGLTQYGL